MISAEAPIVLAKACQLFIIELTLRAWNQTQSSNRKILQKSHISDAVSQSEMYDCNLILFYVSLD